MSLVAAKVGTTTRTVRKWCEAFEDNGDVEDAYRCGRPRLLSDNDEERLIAASVANPFETPRQLKHELDLHCSVQTARRVLDSAGLFARIARVTPPLSADHRRKRVSFAEGYDRMENCIIQ